MITRSSYYIRVIMGNDMYEPGSDQADARRRWFIARCRAEGLKVTPQRLAVFEELIKTDEHPSAEMLWERVRVVLPTISLDTVNRTLLTLTKIGAAFIVEGSGDAKRYDGGREDHQHFRCVECKRIIDFHHEAFDEIEVPPEIGRRFTVLRKTVYFEGICDKCKP